MDPVNFTRLTLFYLDEIVQVGLEVMRKTTAYQKANDSQELTLREDLLKCFEQSKTFFYRLDRPSLTAVRKESSEILYDGKVRQRGSVLNLLYFIPSLSDI